MVPYRCYFLNRSNRIGDVLQLDAANDASAMDAARAVLAYSQETYTAIEVWQGPKKVGGAARDDLDDDVAWMTAQAAARQPIDVI